MWLFYVVHYTVNVIQTFWLNVPSTATKNFYWFDFCSSDIENITNLEYFCSLMYQSQFDDKKFFDTQCYIYSVVISFTAQIIYMRLFIPYIFFMYSLSLCSFLEPEKSDMKLFHEYFHHSYSTGSHMVVELRSLN